MPGVPAGIIWLTDMNRHWLVILLMAVVFACNRGPNSTGPGERSSNLHQYRIRPQGVATTLDSIYLGPGAPSGSNAGQCLARRNSDGEYGNLEKVQSIVVVMEPGQQAIAYHYVPRKRNSRLVIVHQGHVCDTAAAGVGPLIRDLVRNGYSVLAMNMPRCRPGDCSADCTAAHNEMFASVRLSQGSPLKFFLEPIALSLNYLQSHGVDGKPYSIFNMVGLSGGGWTTTVYAAIDPRVILSFPWRERFPLYLRNDGSVGDVEQTLPDFYRIAGYLDLYVLGSSGAGRKQVQILNERDDCCFGVAQHKTPATYKEDLRGYERLVQQTLGRLGAGAFKLHIDSIAPHHMISGYASTNLILEALNPH